MTEGYRCTEENRAEQVATVSSSWGGEAVSPTREDITVHAEEARPGTGNRWPFNVPIQERVLPWKGL